MVGTFLGMTMAMTMAASAVAGFSHRVDAASALLQYELLTVQTPHDADGSDEVHEPDVAVEHVSMCRSDPACNANNQTGCLGVSVQLEGGFPGQDGKHGEAEVLSSPDHTCYQHEEFPCPPARADAIWSDERLRENSTWYLMIDNHRGHCWCFAEPTCQHWARQGRWSVLNMTQLAEMRDQR